MPETSIALEDDFGTENLHSECFKYDIAAPVFSARNDNEVIDLDSREWLTDKNNEMKLIADRDRILRILTDSIVLETGILQNREDIRVEDVFRYFAKLTNRLTIFSTAPMRFVRF